MNNKRALQLVRKIINCIVGDTECGKYRSLAIKIEALLAEAGINEN